MSTATIEVHHNTRHLRDKMRQLTDLAIKALPHPAEGNTKHLDPSLPGFGIRCTARSKSFFVMFGKARRLQTIGRWPEMALKDARKAAYGILHKPPPKRSLSDQDALHAFLGETRDRLRRSTSERYRFALLRHMDGIDLTTSEPNEVKALKVFFNWCMDRGLRDVNPFARRKVRFAVRDRLLADDEIAALLRYEHAPYSDIVKALVYTGQRRAQFANFDPAWVEGETFVFPGKIMKSHRVHTIPATPYMLELAAKLVAHNGWSKSKVRMDEKTGVTGYVLHDIRRYFSSTMARLGVPIHVTEYLLDHRATVSGVAAVYNRYSFQPEMRDALTRYEGHLSAILASAQTG